MSQTVRVKTALWDWALERSERSGVDPGDVKRSFPKLPEWRAQEAEPTRRQLESFAKKTLTPLGYFFLPEPPEEKLPLPDFRTKPEARNARPSPNLLDTIYAIQARQSWLSEYLERTGHDKVQFARRLKDQSIDAAVGALREKLKLAPHWAAAAPTWTKALDLLRDAAQENGVFTVINGVVGNNTHRRLDPDEFRGFVFPDDYAPMVFVNGADAKSAQIFTLAHELAHLLIGAPGLFDLPRFRANSTDTEKFCNAVAAEFLVPRAELRQRWPSARTQSDPYGYLARYFKVSPAVIALRAADLQLITRGSFDEWFDPYVAREKKKSGTGGNFFNNQNYRVGKRFARIVMGAAKSGRLLYRDAYRLTGLYGETFNKYAKLLGITL